MTTIGNRVIGRARSLKRSAAVCALAVMGALALTGCVKFDMDVTVNRDDTVSGTLVVAFDKAVLDRLGASSDPLGEGAVRGVTSQKPYDDGTFKGTEYVYENTPLSEFNDTDADDGDYIRIGRDGQNYVLSGVADTRYEPPGDGGPLDQAITEAMPRADMRVTVTFPGAVLSSNGDVSGRTVTWQLKMGERNELEAVAGPGGNPELALWVLWISLAAVVLVFLLILFQLMRVSLRP